MTDRSLADMNADGKMDKKEFSIAMHLISKKLHGFELPRVLPPSMKQEPTMSGVGFGGMMGGQMNAPASMGQAIPQMAMQQQVPMQMGVYC